MPSTRALLAAALLVAACSADNETSTTTVDITTTTSSASTPTTRPQLIDGGLVPADPATLIPFEDAEPIIVGRAHSGTVSADGSKTAIKTLLSGGTFLVTLIETGANEVLSSVAVDEEPQLLTIDDAGTAYWLGGTTGSDLLLLGLGADTVYVTAGELPLGFTPYGEKVELLGDNRIGMVGSYPLDDRDSRLVSVVEIEPSGAITTHDMPEIETEVDIDGETYSVRPDYAWDHDNNRVLVVEASRDIVNELNLETGVITEHPWDGIGPATQRDVVLSPDGTRLFIASAGEEVADDNLVRAPQNLVVLDPVDWASGEIVDIAVDHLHPSPDGVIMLAQGAEVTTTATGTSIRPSPVYLVDMFSAQAGIGFQVSDAAEATVQFSADGAFAYLGTHEDGSDMFAILDITSQELVGRAGFTRFSLIGPAGLVAFYQQ